jgi:hypothetical protein
MQDSTGNSQKEKVKQKNLPHLGETIHFLNTNFRTQVFSLSFRSQLGQ